MESCTVKIILIARDDILITNSVDTFINQIYLSEIPNFVYIDKIIESSNVKPNTPFQFHCQSCFWRYFEFCLPLITFCRIFDI